LYFDQVVQRPGNGALFEEEEVESKLVVGGELLDGLGVETVEL